MQAVFLRRMMVLVVCALGVGALYLVPGLVAPTRTGVPAPAPPAALSDDSAGLGPAPAPDNASTAARSAARTAGRTQASGAQPAPAHSSAESVGYDQTTAPGSTPPRLPDATDQGTGSHPARASSTPFDADTVADDATPPGPVTALSVEQTDPEQVRLSWAAGTDDVGVVRYRIWLNGYEVESTSETGATLDWFNDDSTKQVVVVRAEDAAGNQSPTAATLLLSRPDPIVTQAPSPTPDQIPSIPAGDASAPPSPTVETKTP